MKKDANANGKIPEKLSKKQKRKSEIKNKFVK